jgi:hypothetical protein
MSQPLIKTAQFWMHPKVIPSTSGLCVIPSRIRLYYISLLFHQTGVRAAPVDIEGVRCHAVRGTCGRDYRGLYYSPPAKKWSLLSVAVGDWIPPTTGELRRGPPTSGTDLSLVDAVTAALWDPGQRTQVSFVHTADLGKLRDSKCVLF